MPSERQMCDSKAELASSQRVSDYSSHHKDGEFEGRRNTPSRRLRVEGRGLCGWRISRRANRRAKSAGVRFLTLTHVSGVPERAPVQHPRVDLRVKDGGVV